MLKNMRQAWSALFPTNLDGRAQGLTVALTLVTRGACRGLAMALVLVQEGGRSSRCCSAQGLSSSFLDLGRPERAWRAAAVWCTS